MAALRETTTGRDFPLTGPSATIGRAAECDIQVNSPQVSGRHAMILSTNDAYYLTDLGSSNGTQINGQRVKGSTRLNPGDLIDLCGPTFAFVDGAGLISTVHVPAFALRDAPATMAKPA